MAKVTQQLVNSILVVNAAFMSDSGNVQAYACRERGDSNAKTIKVSPVLVKGRVLMAGDVLYVTKADVEDNGSNYRSMRSGIIDFDLNDAADSATPQGSDRDHDPAYRDTAPDASANRTVVDDDIPF
jgi:hypothetical protein